MRPRVLLWLFASLAVANVGFLVFGLVAFTGLVAFLWTLFFGWNELVLIAAGVFVFNRFRKEV